MASADFLTIEASSTVVRRANVVLLTTIQTTRTTLMVHSCAVGITGHQGPPTLPEYVKHKFGENPFLINEMTNDYRVLLKYLWVKVNLQVLIFKTVRAIATTTTTQCPPSSRDSPERGKAGNTRDDKKLDKKQARRKL